MALLSFVRPAQRPPRTARTMAVFDFAVTLRSPVKKFTYQAKLGFLLRLVDDQK
jgi:hypothetical protein